MSIVVDKRIAAGLAALALLVAACTNSHNAVVPSGPSTVSQAVPHQLHVADDCSDPGSDDTPIECLPDIPVSAVYIPAPEIIPPTISLPPSTVTPGPIATAEPTTSPQCAARLAMFGLAHGAARTAMLHISSTKNIESGFFFYVDASGNVQLSPIMLGSSDGVGISQQTILNTLSQIPGGGSRVIGWIHSHDTSYYANIAGSNPSLENAPSSTSSGGDYDAFEWLVSDENVPAGATTFVMGLTGTVGAYVPDGKGGWNKVTALGCASSGGAVQQ